MFYNCESYPFLYDGKGNVNEGFLHGGNLGVKHINMLHILQSYYN